ncbi:MAG: glycerophosphodiester phosphodiesterase [Betaproteobacteria bacterium]|nr:glycerophosphodiester phosphodiesterase [Betaproteobacteria bacterium]
MDKACVLAGAAIRLRWSVIPLLGALGAAPAGGGDAAPRPAAREKPIVIAHRGASGYFPEHTLAAYGAAIDMGADFIEPDLVMTRDGMLIARHENALAIVDEATGGVIETTTNVHTLPQFAARRTTRLVDDKRITGWFAEDFTLAEIRTLRARERIPRERPRNTEHDDRYPIPTLQEIIDLAKQRSAELGRAIGIYPETKHPSYHAAIGLPLEPALLEVLAANGWNDVLAPVFIQSFETQNLRALRRVTSVRLIQLLDARGRPWDLQASSDPRTYADLATAEGLREIARYADGVGPHKALVIGRTLAGGLDLPSQFVRDAHAAGLLVHPWTFRAENAFLPLEFRRGDDRAERGDGQGEVAAFLRTDIDGFFTDHPDVGVAAVAALQAR